MLGLSQHSVIGLKKTDGATPFSGNQSFICPHQTDTPRQPPPPNPPSPVSKTDTPTRVWTWYSPADCTTTFPSRWAPARSHGTRGMVICLHSKQCDGVYKECSTPDGGLISPSSANQSKGAAVTFSATIQVIRERKKFP